MRVPFFKIAPLLLACISLLPVASAETVKDPVCPQLSVDAVVNNLVRNNLERAQALPAFQSTRIYRAEYRGFPGARSAEMVVDMEFRPPATKTFSIRSQTGSKLIIDRVFKKLLEGEKEASDAENQRRIALNNENYAFTLLGCELVAHSAVYTLNVEPKIASKFLYRGKILVDAHDFAVVQMNGEPAKNPSFWIRQTQIEQIYGKVNQFWLPSRNHSMTTVRLGGHADFTIDYKDYRFAAASADTTGAVRASGPR